MHNLLYLRFGNRVRLGPWINGPGWRPAGASRDNPHPFEPYDGDLQSQDNVRASKWRTWEAYFDKMSRHIPRAVHKPGVKDPKPYIGVIAVHQSEDLNGDIIGELNNEASGIVSAGNKPCGETDNDKEDDDTVSTISKYSNDQILHMLSTKQSDQGDTASNIQDAISNIQGTTSNIPYASSNDQDVGNPPEEELIGSGPGGRKWGKYLFHY